jgi:hypothetical protein
MVGVLSFERYLRQLQSALIIREPKQDLKVTTSWLLRLKVGFGLTGVTLSNAGGVKKVCM